MAASCFGFIEKYRHGHRLLHFSDDLLYSKSLLVISPEKKFGLFISHDSNDASLSWELAHRLFDELFPEVEKKQTRDTYRSFKRFRGTFQSNAFPTSTFECIKGLTSQFRIFSSPENQFNLKIPLVSATRAYRPGPGTTSPISPAKGSNLPAIAIMNKEVRSECRRRLALVPFCSEFSVIVVEYPSHSVLLCKVCHISR